MLRGLCAGAPASTAESLLAQPAGSGETARRADTVWVLGALAGRPGEAGRSPDAAILLAEAASATRPFEVRARALMALGGLAGQDGAGRAGEGAGEPRRTRPCARWRRARWPSVPSRRRRRRCGRRSTTAIPGVRQIAAEALGARRDRAADAADHRRRPSRSRGRRCGGRRSWPWGSCAGGRRARPDRAGDRAGRGRGPAGGAAGAGRLPGRAGPAAAALGAGWPAGESRRCAPRRRCCWRSSTRHGHRRWRRRSTACCWRRRPTWRWRRRRRPRCGRWPRWAARPRCEAALQLRSDPRPVLRRSASEALGKLCDPGAGAEALRAATRDPDRRSRRRHRRCGGGSARSAARG